MDGDFIFGFVLGAVIVAIAMTPKHLKGFKDLVVGVYNKLFKKGNSALIVLPYWLEWRLVVAVMVGGFLFVVWKDNDGSLGIIPKSFYEFFKRLWNMFVHNIEDEEAYKQNEAQRKADEEYKKQLKKKKKTK